MRNRLLITIFLLAVSTMGFGQVVSGFKGKRVWAGVKMGAFPIPTSDGLVNGGLNFSLDIVAKNYVSFSAQFLYGTNHKPLKTNDNYSYSYGSRYINIDKSIGTFHTSETGLDIGFKFYRKRRGALAPLGKHVDIGIRFKSVKLNYENLVVDGIKATDINETGEYTYTSAIPYMGFGWEKVFSDKLLFHLGVISELDLVTLATISLGADRLTEGLHNAMLNRNASYGLLRLNFGVKFAL